MSIAVSIVNRPLFRHSVFSAPSLFQQFVYILFYILIISYNHQFKTTYSLSCILITSTNYSRLVMVWTICCVVQLWTMSKFAQLLYRLFNWGQSLNLHNRLDKLEPFFFLTLSICFRHPFGQATRDALTNFLSLEQSQGGTSASI